MPHCPHYAQITRRDTDERIEADFIGEFAANAFSLFRRLATAVRAAQPPRPVRLDLTFADPFDDSGIPGVLAVVEAASESGVALEILPGSAEAIDLLTQAGLGPLLHSGP